MLTPWAVLGDMLGRQPLEPTILSGNRRAIVCRSWYVRFIIKQPHVSHQAIITVRPELSFFPALRWSPSTLASCACVSVFSDLYPKVGRGAGESCASSHPRHVYAVAVDL